MVIVKNNFAIIALCLLLSNVLIGQSNSQFSVRFDFDTVYCDIGVVTIDVEVKANYGYPLFNLAEQNYRFSFEDQVLVNPRIIEELEVTGTLFGNVDTGGGTTVPYTAFYDPHHLNGSLDTIISYNVVLGGGSGYPLKDKRWYPVGRLAFDIVDDDACINLKWHTHAPEDYPPTYVGEKYGGAAGTLFEVEEGSYLNLHLCGWYKIFCPPLPIEISNIEVEDLGCSNELRWTTLSETENDYFSIEKSIDGIRWNSIGEISGAGNSLDPIDYVFQDEKITSQLNYYRIRQYDFDGKSSVSEQVTVRSSCFNDKIAVGITQLFPNPVVGNDRVNIEFYTDRDTDAELVVTDELGRIVKLFPQSLAAGRNVLSFKSKLLAAGVYFVQIKGEGWYSGVQKLVKISE